MVSFYSEHLTLVNFLRYAGYGILLSVALYWLFPQFWKDYHLAWGCEVSFPKTVSNLVPLCSHTWRAWLFVMSSWHNSLRPGKRRAAPFVPFIYFWHVNRETRLP